MSDKGEDAASDRTFARRLNFRDYGGYRALDDARLVSGLLYRSAEPERAGADGLRQFRKIGFSAIVDFRNRHEAPAVASAPIAARRVAGDIENGVVPHAIERFRGLADAEAARAAMRQVYLDLVTGPHFLDTVGRYLTALATTDGPTLVHCVAGKDRTGLAVALFQSLLGVRHEDIAREFLLTNAGGQPRKDYLLSALAQEDALQGMLPEVMEELLGVRAEFLETAFAHIAGNADHPADYLVRHAGIEPRLPDMLREKFLLRAGGQAV